MASCPLRPLMAAVLLAALSSVLLVADSPSSTPSASPVRTLGECSPLERSSDMDAFCVRSTGLSPTCCNIVKEAAASGGLICLCYIARTPAIATSGFGPADLLLWYDRCGGNVPADAHLLAQCGVAGHTAKMESPPHSLPALGTSANRTQNEDPSLGTNSTPQPVPTEPKKQDSNETESASPTLNKPQQPVPSNQETMNGNSVAESPHSRKIVIMIRIQTWHIIVGVGVVIFVLVVTGLWIYIRCSAPGPRRDKAQGMLDTLRPFLPFLFKEALKEVQERQNKPWDETTPREEEALPPILSMLLKAAMKEAADGRKEGRANESNDG